MPDPDHAAFEAWRAVARTWSEDELRREEAYCLGMREALQQLVSLGVSTASVGAMLYGIGQAQLAILAEFERRGATPTVRAVSAH